MESFSIVQRNDDEQASQFYQGCFLLRKHKSTRINTLWADLQMHSNNWFNWTKTHFDSPPEKNRKVSIEFEKL